MSTKYLFRIIVALSIFSQAAFASGKPVEELKHWAREAISPDQKVSDGACNQLRGAGPQGLSALFDEHSALIAKHKKTGGSPFHEKRPKYDPAWEKLRAAMDFVGQQRDCYVSRLYWLTDFDEAKAEAKASGKPILSLRLLGKLDEEFSCANSRFFRTTLYANAEVSEFLRENFVLHWKSVRPVPRLTIDFGDGRKLERTITGNSIHYILDTDGKPIDALPGLYGPKAFLDGIAHARKTFIDSQRLSGAAREDFLIEYHRERLSAITSAWREDLENVNRSISLTGVNDAPKAFPAAVRAGNLAVGKSMVERPLLKAMSFPEDLSIARMQTEAREGSWAQLALLHAADAQLDENARELINRKNVTALEASRVAFTKSVAEAPVLRMLRNLERSIAEDTVRNEYQLHSRLHEWFVARTATADVDQLNRKVYAELFLTPDSDPWLGLAPAGSFSALENDGLIPNDDLQVFYNSFTAK